jgi:fermentation-respiration switch protein FrsA (DUF1100 family)
VELGGAGTERLEHVEVFTMGGLLTLLRHGDPTSPAVALLCGGAMGGLLGPAGGLYHDLGRTFASLGIATVRVGYRQPGELGSCLLDLMAAADLSARTGAERFVVVGHSFGGAVAVNAGIALGDHCRGVVTLSTQSAGCERAERLTAPLLLLHGDHDEILPAFVSEAVQQLASQAPSELVVLPGTGHLLTEAHGELRARLGEWIPARLSPGD